MTLLSVATKKERVSSGEDMLDTPSVPLTVDVLTTKEAEVFHSVKQWLGEVNERVLVHVIKDHCSTMTSTVRNVESMMNDIIGFYFDKIQPDIDRPDKKVRFDENGRKDLHIPPVERPTSIVNSSDASVKIIEVGPHGCEDRNSSSSKWPGILGNTISLREEQDVIKAIEESLRDSRNVPDFSPFAQGDPDNPHERRRIDSVPVGLKNIGNSCWFNVIIQTLFHFPCFRRSLIEFDYSKTKAFINASISEETDTPLDLLLGLRRLFGFILCSNRAYVDPTDVLKILNAVNTSQNKGSPPCLGIQQDATEMLLRLVEWLEKAFSEYSITDTAKLEDIEMKDTSVQLLKDSEAARIDNSVQNLNTAQGLTWYSAVDDPSISPYNPFSSFFHGSHVELRMLQEGVISSSILENSLQLVNLDVSFDNFHDSLEAYHLSDYPVKEIWFDTPPPVIIFSLGRFSYKNGQTEKVHSKFQFPCEFFLDSYLYDNRAFVHEKRNERAHLKNVMENLKNELRSLEEHQVGDSRESLASIMSVAADYLSFYVLKMNSSERQLIDSSNGPMDSHCSVSSADFNDHGCGNRTFRATGYENDYETARSAIRFMRQISDCVKAKISELHLDVERLKENVDATFNMDIMRKEGYRLHGVIIHEGEANVGHYWAYIADYSALDESGCPVIWRRFNDKGVERTTWQQIEEDSYGSRRNCSAYCLIYTRKRLENELFGKDGIFERPISDLMETLPMDLRMLISENNANFAGEIERWDSKVLPIESGQTCSSNFSGSIYPSSLDFPDVKNSLDLKLIGYQHGIVAYEYFGVAILRSGMRSTAVAHLNSIENAERVFYEIIEHRIFHLNAAVKSVSDVSGIARLLLVTEWARLYGLSVSAEAEIMLIVRMLQQSSEQNVMSLSRVFLQKLEADSDFPHLEEEVNRIDMMYELFCGCIQVLSDTMKSIEFSVSIGSLIHEDIVKCKNLCAAIYTLDKIGSFSFYGIQNSIETDFLNLVLNALLIAYCIKISQDCMRFEPSSDYDGAELANFFNSEYKAMLCRICLHRGEAFEQATKYIHTLWNSSKFSDTWAFRYLHQVVMEAFDVEGFTGMPPIQCKFNSAEISKDLISLKQCLTKARLKTADDLSRVVDLLVLGESVTSS